MSTKRRDRVDAIALEALSKAGSDRAAFLEEACGGDADLRREVEWLLAGQEVADQFLETPAWAEAVLTPGSRLGPYEILAKAGAGGMGEVYIARDSRLDRTVAIKVLPPGASADPERRARFEREAKTIAGLNHPHICTLHDVGEQEGSMFLVMEHLAGDTLAARLEKGPLPLEQALTIATEVAEALAAAHRQGVVHRDLKPANVMLTRSGGGSTSSPQAKLLDFGLAKLTGHGEQPAASYAGSALPQGGTLTRPGVIVGTLQYMAPEQVEGKPADARTDIWALGAILYEMVTGRRAFAGDSAASLIAAILEREPEPIASLQPLTPPALERVVRTCLEKDPDARWQAASDVARELQWIADDSSAERPPSAGLTHAARGSTSLRRRLTLYAFAVIAGSLAVATGLLWRFGGWQAPAPPRLVHVTTEPGIEEVPALSPDGKQVAYQWPGEDGANRDIWVKLLGGTESRRLTSDPLPDGVPCWSPDGARIAFWRAGGPGRQPSVFLMTALGGDERRLAEVPNPVSRMAWSPNGKWLAVPRGRPADARSASVAGIHSLPVSGGDATRVTSAPVPAEDTYPVFSPDGGLLAFARTLFDSSSELYIQRLTGEGRPDGVPRQITRAGYLIHGVAWHPDGKSLIIAAQPAFNLSYLYRVSLAGGRAPERIEMVSSGAYRPSTAPGVARLAFVASRADSNIWRLTKGGVPEPVIQSSLFEWSPALSPDGLRVAFTTNRNGETTEIWTADADGSRQRQLTHGPGRNQGSAAWSPDGRTLAFDSQEPDGTFAIYVIDSGGGQPLRVTSEPSDEQVPSWSRDGRWIYFRSNRSGFYQWWRTLSSGGEWEQVTAGVGLSVGGSETVDGKGFVYLNAKSEVCLRPLDGRAETKIVDFTSSPGFALAADGIYYFGRRGADNKVPLLFRRLPAGATTELTRVDSPTFGPAVSHDGNTVFYTAGAYGERDIMLIEGFR